MASYIQIYFDRTKPEVEIHAPNYTTANIINEITVVANEPLSSSADFYIEDSQGNRHDYEFAQSEPNVFTGLIRLNTMPLGIVKVFGQVRDLVDNESDLVMATIEIKEVFELLTMNESHRSHAINTKERTHHIKTAEKKQEVKNIEKQRTVKTSDRIRVINVTEKKSDIDT